MSNILFIGAHPDDIELSCGGTLIKHIEKKDNVFVIIISDGEKGFNGTRNGRIKETKKSLYEAGVKKSNTFFPHVPDTLFIENRKKILSEIERICDECKIDKVYTHTDKEYHQDHIVAFEETLRAARRVPNILTYESMISSLPTFCPNYFVDITDVFNKKMSMVHNHTSQSNKVYFEKDFLRSVARFRGAQAKKSYAEGFEVIRMLGQHF